ncbi:hypothetical protein SAMN05421837_112244 [Amycolatopsis pretoriensis]|uniref:Uncharacterized protein n=1 Tax=Amycolatopsis pretoriensis TaxID=218821 RepID=A0A1H5RI12_9PSEU|nr:hypothetical protein SAMN05421837_112244 [Amycolatopsis pretoriensis]
MPWTCHEPAPLRLRVIVPAHSLGPAFAPALKDATDMNLLLTFSECRTNAEWKSGGS